MSCFLLFVTLKQTFRIAKIERKPRLWAGVVDLISSARLGDTTRLFPAAPLSTATRDTSYAGLSRRLWQKPPWVLVVVVCSLEIGLCRHPRKACTAPSGVSAR